MPRAPRVHLEGVIYYVTLEGPNQEEIFWDSQDYQKYLELLIKYKEEFKFKLFSYVILPHRLHLVIEANDKFPISHIMQKITPLYTKYYNGRYQRKGPLFQKRFRSVLVEKETYLPQLTRFVHLTPVRAGVVSNPKDYSHSSYAAFIGNTSFSHCEERSDASRSSGGRPLGHLAPIGRIGEAIPNPEIASAAFGRLPRNDDQGGHLNPLTLQLSAEVEEVLHYLPNPRLEDAYERYVLSADQEEIEFLNRKLSRGAFLGSEPFVERVKKHIDDLSKKNHEDLEDPNVGAPLVGTHNLESRAGTRPAPTFSVSKRLVALSGLLVFAISLSAFSVVYNYQTMISSNTVIPAQAGIHGLRSLIKTFGDDTRSSAAAISRAKIPTLSPDLNGTVWEVELVSEEPDGKMKSIHDKIRFTGKAFESRYFTSHGFSSSNYTVTVNDSGVITWETMQKNDLGELVSWRGDWQGNKMEGVLSYRPEGQNPQDFSFMSQQFGVQK